MRRAVLALAGLFCPGGVWACPGGAETVLSCTVQDEAKRLEVCLSETHLSYLFAEPMGGAIELALAEPIETVAHQPWLGVGRSIWESLTFQNGDYHYETYLSVDRLAENPVPEGGVIVYERGKVLTELACDPTSAVISVFAVSDAKEAQGLCWSGNDYAYVGCEE